MTLTSAQKSAETRASNKACAQRDAALAPFEKELQEAIAPSLEIRDRKCARIEAEFQAAMKSLLAERDAQIDAEQGMFLYVTRHDFAKRDEARERLTAEFIDPWREQIAQNQAQNSPSNLS